MSGRFAPVSTEAAAPYWRLSGFYFFYFAVVGALMPYWALYLQSLHFTAVQIGELMALLLVSRIVAPNIWGWLGDHRGQRLTVVHWAAFLAVVAYGGVFAGTGFRWLAAVMLLFSFFWNAALPQLEAATMNHLGGRAGEYARVRLWGSVGFIVTVVALGQLFDRAGIVWLLPAILALLAGIWLFSLAIPELALPAWGGAAVPLRQLFRRPEVATFLLACLLMQASHGPYYTFYSIYLRGQGYTTGVIGGLWALGVVCEVGVFLIMRRLQRHIPLRRLLLASFLVAALRWLLIGHFPQSLAILAFAQTLHAVTFGAFHASAIEMVHTVFTGKYQCRGQAIYGSASFGVGGALGSLYSGLTWSSLGAAGTYTVAAGLALAAFAVAFLGLRPRNGSGGGGTGLGR